MSPTDRPLLLAALGASNLRFGLRQLLAAVSARRGDRAVDVLAAAGPGRSFGVTAGAPPIFYEGISRSAVFAELEMRRAEAADLPIAALITDVGNDIGYGVDVETIISWVTLCVRRLQRLDARIVMTGIPVEGIASMPKWLFYLVRTIIFPMNRHRHHEVVSRLQALQSRLRQLAVEAEAVWIEVDPSWYGPDRFHLEPSQRLTVMAGWLAPLLGTDMAAAPPPLELPWWQLNWLWPLPTCYLLGWPCRGRVEALTVAEQVQLTLY